MDDFVYNEDAGKFISDILKGDDPLNPEERFDIFQDNKPEDKGPEDFELKKSQTKKEKKDYSKKQKAFEKELKKKEKEQLKNTPKNQKRRENLKKIKEFGKSLFEKISDFFTKARYFIFNGPVKYKEWRDLQARQEAKYKVESSEKKDLPKDINSQIIQIAKAKEFDVVIKDDKKRQEKKIYFSGKEHDAMASINKFGQIIDIKAAKITPAEKGEYDKINSIIQDTRKQHTTNKDYDTSLCENFKRAGFEASIGENCIYISKNDKNFVIREQSRPNPQIFSQTVVNNMMINSQVAEFAKAIQESTKKHLENKLDCHVDISTDEKGTYVTLEEKDSSKLTEKTLYEILEKSKDLTFKYNDRDYVLQKTEKGLLLKEQGEDGEIIYDNKESVLSKLKEIGIVAEQQKIRLDEHGDAKFTNSQLNNDLCKKFEKATHSISSFQDYSEKETKNITIKKLTERTIKNANNLSPGESFEREQDGFFIKAVCGSDGACVISVIGKDDSSEQVAMSGNTKNVSSKLENAITQAYAQADTRDFDDLNKDGVETVVTEPSTDMFDKQAEFIADSIDIGDDIEN